MTQIQRISFLQTSKGTKETKKAFVLLVFFDVSALWAEPLARCIAANNANLSKIKQIMFDYETRDNVTRESLTI
jgi:hypothetical protein